MTAGYRADNLRAWKQTAAGRTYYYYDGGVPVLETDATGTVTAQNVFASDGLVARYQGGWIYYTFDQQGNVTQRLDASGTVLSASTFDSYGMESTSGSPSDPFGYNGRGGYIEDRETGLYYCHNRYFDPSTGRWINRDPIRSKGGLNLYGYAAGQPVNRLDPSGLMSIGDVWDDAKSGVAQFASIFVQVPQQILGELAAIGGHPVRYLADSDTVVIQGAWLPVLTGRPVTLGKYALFDDDDVSETRLAHEVQHRPQSEYLGPLYLPATLAGYTIGACRSIVYGHGLDGLHDASPLEMDADSRSEVEFFVQNNWTIQKFWTNSG